MCSPSSPTVNQTVTPPPAAAPQPLALAEPSTSGANISQLRIGSKANTKMRAPTTSLQIPTPPSQGAPG